MNRVQKAGWITGHCILILCCFWFGKLVLHDLLQFNQCHPLQTWACVALMIWAMWRAKMFRR